MKKLLLILLYLPMIGFAQNVPQGINYQAVARDVNDAVLMNQTLMIQFSVISDLATSAVSWQETHTVNTNDYGLFTAIIGQGTTTYGGSSAAFDSINWGASNHLLKVEVDYGGGLLDMGTTAFMSVPYAINSTPQNLTISGDTLFISSGNWIILPSSAPTLLGCTDSTATNYNPLANTDDGSCDYNWQNLTLNGSWIEDSVIDIFNDTIIYNYFPNNWVFNDSLYFINNWGVGTYLLSPPHLTIDSTIWNIVNHTPNYFHIYNLTNWGPIRRDIYLSRVP